jgi:hypothetical protein
MRKTLLASLLMTLAAAAASAAPMWYDVITNYPVGGITTNSGGLWFAHPPGSLTATDALIVTNTYTSGAAVNGKMLRVNGLNSQYVMRLFDSAATNSLQNGSVYASFIANANFVPSAGQGTYFATFNGVYPFSPPDGTSATNSFQFRGHVYEIGNTNVFPNTNTVGLTYRFGVANNAGDPAQGGGPSIIYVPIDLIKGVDYQVVMKYDIDNAVAYLWVNPASESDTANWSGPTSDLGAITNGLAGLLFRQRTGGGAVDVRDVAVGLSFADVVTNVAATSPVLVATNYNTVTNYSGNPALLEVFATSIGGGPLNYQWYRVSGGTTNPVGANSQLYYVPSLSGADTGNYFCAVTNSGSKGAVSTSAFYISVNTASTAPTFSSKPPTTTNGTVGGKITLSAAAAGTGPLSFQWSFNGTPLVNGGPVTGNPGDLSVVSGAQTPTLTVTGLSTNETGNYTVTVTGGVTPAATASTAVTVNPARAVSIAYIRSLEDTNTWQVTDTASIFTISNAVVTMYTNVTSGTTASYYIQDATGGLDLFVTGDASFRPTMGDIVNVSGTLSSFSNAIELLIDTSNPYEFYFKVGHTNVVPAPMVVPLSVTNNAGNMETNIEGKIVMLTNVTFTNASLTTPTGNGSLYVTNDQGTFQIFFPAGTDPDVRSKTIANRFAWTITGVMAQFKSGAWNNSTYEVYVTRIGDIVTNPPPPVTAAAALSGSDVVLSWTAVPYTPDTRGAYAYSVLAATNVTGPYLPLATGLAFNTPNATFTHTNGLSGAQTFYRVSSP